MKWLTHPIHTDRARLTKDELCVWKRGQTNFHLFDKGTIDSSRKDVCGECEKVVSLHNMYGLLDRGVTVWMSPVHYFTSSNWDWLCTPYSASVRPSHLSSRPAWNNCCRCTGTCVSALIRAHTWCAVSALGWTSMVATATPSSVTMDIETLGARLCIDTWKIKENVPAWQLWALALYKIVHSRRHGKRGAYKQSRSNIYPEFARCLFKCQSFNSLLTDIRSLQKNCKVKRKLKR